jgi:hypothetical protein
VSRVVVFDSLSKSSLFTGFFFCWACLFLKRVSKKDVVVTSVAWDLSNTDHNVSGNILIGSSKGQLFECVLDAVEKGSTKVFSFFFLFFKTKQVWKPVFNTESNQAVEGLVVERIIGASKCYVMAVTATRIYEFCGANNFTSLFEQFRMLFVAKCFKLLFVFFVVNV